MSRRWSHCSYSQLPDLQDLESQLSFHLACCALPPGQLPHSTPAIPTIITTRAHNHNGVAPTLHKSHLNLLLVVHLWQTRASISCVAHDRWQPTTCLQLHPAHTPGALRPTGRAEQFSQATLLLLKLKPRQGWPQSSREGDTGQQEIKGQLSSRKPRLSSWWQPPAPVAVASWR